jgi:predicted PurR-regulated permease PerM
MTTERWRIALWLVMLTLVLWVAWAARGALIPFVIGAVLAYALSPVVDHVASILPARNHRQDVIRRGVVVGLIYLLFFGSLTGIGFAIVPTAVHQAGEFIDVLPEFVEDARLEFSSRIERFRAELPADMRDDIERATQDFGQTATAAVGLFFRGTMTWVTSTIGLVAALLIVPFWTFYALRDRHFVERNFMRAVPPRAQADVSNVARIADHMLGRYIRAQLLLGVVVGSVVGVAMTLLGVQFSIGLGLWAGVTELIPILGPWLGAAAGLIVVLATDPGLFVWVALVYFAVQILENNLLVPRIQGGAVDLHPAMIILLLAVAGAIWGLLGMVIVVPLTAIMRELFWYADRRLRGESPIEAFAHSHAGARQADLPFDQRLDDPALVAANEQAVRSAE